MPTIRRKINTSYVRGGRKPSPLELPQHARRDRSLPRIRVTISTPPQTSVLTIVLIVFARHEDVAVGLPLPMGEDRGEGHSRSTDSQQLLSCGSQTAGGLGRIRQVSLHPLLKKMNSLTSILSHREREHEIERFMAPFAEQHNGQQTSVRGAEIVCLAQPLVSFLDGIWLQGVWSKGPKGYRPATLPYLTFLTVRSSQSMSARASSAGCVQCNMWPAPSRSTRSSVAKAASRSPSSGGW